MAKLTNHKQEKFCLNYLKDPSHEGRAYTRAGYKAKGKVASAAACRLLKNVNIKKRLEELNGKVERSAIMSRQESLELATRIARGSVITNFITTEGKTVSLDEMSNLEAAVAIQSVEVVDVKLGKKDMKTVKKFKLRDPLNAVEFIAKMEGWLAPEKQQHSFDKIEDLPDDQLERLAED